MIAENLIIILSLLIISVSFVRGIRFQIDPNGQKCLKEELQAQVLVSGEYEVSEAPGQQVDYIVRDSKGHVLSQKEDITAGKFVFSTEVFDMFEICFMSRVPSHQRGVKQEIKLVTKHGAEAKNYEALGEAAKLKPLEVDLKKLEDLTDDIVSDFAHMRKREEEMRDTNESTNNRVLYFSIFSMGCLLSLATWQVLYLRRFFKAKKLID